MLVIVSLACSGTTSEPTATPQPPPPPTVTPKPEATNTPKPTPRPTDTPVPTKPALPPGVLFSDDFISQEASEEKGWSFESGENVGRDWSPGALTLSVNKKNWLGLNWPDGEFDDFGAEVEAQAASAFAEYGLIFRISGKQGSRSYYLFGVTTDGKYYVDKQINGEWADPSPVKLATSQYVKKGKVKNRLGVLAEGSKISLYVNGFLVKSFTDDSIEGGAVGLFAGSGEKDSAEIAFSKFMVLTPAKARADWGITPAGGGTPPQPTPTPTKPAATGGGGTGNGVFTVRNNFTGACQVNLWGKKDASIRAEGKTSKSLSLPPGSYGAKITLANGREGDVPNQLVLPAGGYCTITCEEKTYRYGCGP
jgi:hypothetical protein